MSDDLVTMFLCGDVMTGRGVDQILPHPGDPRLREDSIGGALGYVALAEAANGPIPRPADPAWPWGDALAVLADVAPDVRLINLETGITRSGDFAPGKAGALPDEPRQCRLPDRGPAGCVRAREQPRAGFRAQRPGGDPGHAGRGRAAGGGAGRDSAGAQAAGGGTRPGRRRAA